MHACYSLCNCLVWNILKWIFCRVYVDQMLGAQRSMMQPFRCMYLQQPSCMWPVQTHTRTLDMDSTWQMQHGAGTLHYTHRHTHPYPTDLWTARTENFIFTTTALQQPVWRAQQSTVLCAVPSPSLTPFSQTHCLMQIHILSEWEVTRGIGNYWPSNPLTGNTPQSKCSVR